MSVKLHHRGRTFFLFSLAPSQKLLKRRLQFRNVVELLLYSIFDIEQFLFHDLAGGFLVFTLAESADEIILLHHFREALGIPKC